MLHAPVGFQLAVQALNSRYGKRTRMPVHTHSSAQLPTLPIPPPPPCRSLVHRSFSAESSPPRVHGGLKDEDRIFTNLYRQHDSSLKVSVTRHTHTHTHMAWELKLLLGPPLCAWTGCHGPR